jgi:hypothetical protein
MIEVIIKPKVKKNIISTVLISKKFYNRWKKYIFKNWKVYCNNHGLGLIIIKDFIDKTETKKKANWQKLLIGKKLKEYNFRFKIENICYLDSDIIINCYGAPNIFNYHKKNRISVVNQYKQLPYNYFETQKRISLLRNLFYSKKYPLDSSIFMTPQQIFKYHGFKKFDNYFCSGLFIFNLKKHSSFLEEIYFKYKKETTTLTGGDEPVINYEFQKLGNLNWLDYKYQAIWLFEMANKYPFLYKFGKNNHKLQSECVSSSLFSNYFLHFAGSWYESDMIYLKNNYTLNKSRNFIKNFYDYLNEKPKADPVGIIRP